MMFEAGTLVVYESSGVCRVDGVGVPAGLPSAEKGRLYYTLTPVHGAGTIYIPVDTRAFMRPVITRDEALELIARIPDIGEAVCDDRDPRMLSAHYRSYLQNHDCESLVQLIKMIYIKSHSMAKNNRKPSMTDMQYMKRAKELLHDELSVALGIPCDEVEGYIRDAVAERAMAKQAKLTALKSEST